MSIIGIHAGGGFVNELTRQHRPGRIAGNPVVRGNHHLVGQCEPDRLGQLLRAAAGGCVHHFGQLPAIEPVRLSHDELGRVVPLSHQGTGGGADCRDFECGGAEGRNTLPADSLRQPVRCGRNHHHLPAGLVAQGVAA